MPGCQVHDREAQKNIVLHKNSQIGTLWALLFLLFSHCRRMTLWTDFNELRDLKHIPLDIKCA